MSVKVRSKPAQKPTHGKSEPSGSASEDQPSKPAFRTHQRDCKILLGPEDYTQEIAGHQFHREIQQLIVKAKAGKAIDPTLGLVIGDCVHNLRSALDHLVLQLAILNGTFAGAERKTAFPICLDRGAFKHAVKNNVAPFISRTALDAIEESQPYRTLDPATNIPLGDQSVLWVLSQLDVIDKHRVILIAAPQVAAEGFTIHGPGGEMYQTPILPVKWKPLKDGEERNHPL